MKSVIASALLAAATAAFKLNDIYNFVNSISEDAEYIGYMSKFSKFYTNLEEY